MWYSKAGLVAGFFFGGAVGKKEKLKNHLALRTNRKISDLAIQVAEIDKNLSEYYVGRDRYVARALDREDPACVFVGPKGVGKSAILQMVRLERDSSVDIINITPDDLAFATVASSASVNLFVSDPQKLQFLFKAMWDYLFSVELLRREHPDRSRIWSTLLSLLGGKETREAELLLQLSVSKDTDGETLSSRFLDLIKEVELSGNVEGVSVAGKASLDASTLKVPQVKLLQMIANVSKRLPDSITRPYYILIDDLDLHWADSPEQNAFIGALLLSVRKLNRPPYLKFCVSLRETIFERVPIEDKDKFRDAVCRVSWERADVKCMVEKRIAYVYAVSEAEVFEKMFPASAFDLLLSHTMGMPRELIRLVALCIEKARGNGGRAVDAADVEAGIREFSKERLADLASFHRTGYPGLDLLVQRFKGKPKEFPLRVVEDVVLDVQAEIERETAASKQFLWAGGYMDDPKGFARILLEIGFLFYKENRTAPARSFDSDSDGDVSTNAWFSINRMYGPALDVLGRVGV